MPTDCGGNVLFPKSGFEQPRDKGPFYIMVSLVALMKNQTHILHNSIQSKFTSLKCNHISNYSRASSEFLTKIVFQTYNF